MRLFASGDGPQQVGKASKAALYGGVVESERTYWPTVANLHDWLAGRLMIDQSARQPSQTGVDATLCAAAEANPGLQLVVNYCSGKPKYCRPTPTLVREPFRWGPMP